MKITKKLLKKIIKEEIEEMITEVALSPAIYRALQGKGQLPPGATVKKTEEPQAMQQSASGQRSGRGNIALMKLLKSYQDELADAPEAGHTPEQVFKLKQKITKLRQMMKKKTTNLTKEGELPSIPGKPGFYIKKIKSGYLVVDKESGEASSGPYTTRKEAEEQLHSVSRNPHYKP